MEAINKHNYELFFLDYIDGNLSQEKIRALFRFLRKNPSLKEELEQFETFSLKPDDIIFENKQDLIKKTQAQHYEITEFEYLCVAEVEKDITGEEKGQLKSELKKQKNKHVLSVFHKLKLQADERITYPYKNVLKKFRVINYGTVSSMAAAAVILLFLVFRGNFSNQHFTKTNENKLSNNYRNKNVLKLNNKQNAESNGQKFTQQEQKLVTHNQTIINSNNNVLAFDDKEPQQMKDLYKDLVVSIPDIKNEALFSNIDEGITSAEIRKTSLNNNKKNPVGNKDRFWKYAEKGVGVWKKITNDDDIVLKNDYAENGSVNEVNFIASNFGFRKTYNKK